MGRRQRDTGTFGRLRSEKLMLEALVDVDRAVMVGNNSISDVEMRSGHHGFTS
jgi:hypothetical protein